MSPSLTRVPLLLVLSLAVVFSAIHTRGAQPNEAEKSAPLPVLPKLAGESVTAEEARVLIRAHAEQRALLEAQRQSTLAAAANLKPEERIALISRFLTATAEIRKQLQDEMPRMADLDFKVRVHEKAESAKK